MFFIIPTIFSGGHIVSPMSVCTSVRMSHAYVRKMVSIPYPVLDSYFIHRYIIIQYRSGLI